MYLASVTNDVLGHATYEYNEKHERVDVLNDSRNAKYLEELARGTAQERVRAEDKKPTENEDGVMDVEKKRK